MAKERTTYVSRDGNYNLDPAKVFDVVKDLSNYMHFATLLALTDNPNLLKPSTQFIGRGRTMSILTEVVGEPGFLASFDLAKLVLSAENDRLALKIHAHPSVAIPSEDLHSIGNKYKR